MVFPARAGMSLKRHCVLSFQGGFPRPRGDEPAELTGYATKAEFSPPARG